MKVSTKIFYLFLATTIVFSGTLLLWSHQEVHFSQFANNIIQALLFFVVLFIFLNEPNKKHKLIFFNFVVFFGLSLFAHIHNFVGAAFLTGSRYASFIFYEYHIAAYVVSLSFAIVYLVVDLLFNNLKTSLKYVTAGSIVLFFFIWNFGPIIGNPLSPYQSEDIQQWKILAKYVDQHGQSTGTEDIAKAINLHAWKNGEAVGDLYPEENASRIEALEPYLEGQNYSILLFKPLFMKMVAMNVMLLFFMLLFFGYQYEKDPPQGAYIDKIMFTFLLFVSTEILHYWGYVKSVEYNLYLGLFNAGQYITIALLLMMVFFFSLRLRFITSITGEFYETELATNPQRITRWKDGIDKLVLMKFFNVKPLRLFHSTGQK